MGKFEKTTPAAPVADEMVDEKLQVVGVKFQDRTGENIGEETLRAEYPTDEKRKDIETEQMLSRAEAEARDVKCQDRTKEVPVDAKCQKAERREKTVAWLAAAAVTRWKLKRWAVLMAADALLIYMCMAGKIELAYGLVALAAASGFLGARVANACL